MYHKTDGIHLLMSGIHEVHERKRGQGEGQGCPCRPTARGTYSEDHPSGAALRG